MIHAATLPSLEPWPSATSKPPERFLRASSRAQRTSAAEREASPRAFAASRSPRWRPTASCSIPKRSHRAIVCAKSRAVTRTSCPSARMRSISGRITSTCGLLVRSTQTRMPADANGPAARLSGRTALGAAPRAAPAALGAAMVARRMLVLASISESLVNIAWHFVRDAGLPAVFVLMVAESACVPIPSEATMLFAGFAVADPGASAAQHHLTLVGIVLAGVLGNLLGSWIAYGVGRAGRLELVERHGRWLHLQPRHIAWADRWFARYGSAAVFFSRMLPIIRTFISLPAGVAKMPFLRFTLLTLAGCVPWELALGLIGEAVGNEWKDIRKGFEYVDYAVV